MKHDEHSASSVKAKIAMFSNAKASVTNATGESYIHSIVPSTCTYIQGPPQQSVESNFA